MASQLICDDCGKEMTNWIETDDNKKYCKPCFNSSHERDCVRCRKPIGTDASVNHDGKPYHSKCFTCYHCRKPLAGASFSKQEGNNVCQDCFRSRYAKTCNKCKRLIEGTAKFTCYEEKFYHSDCFTCAKCDHPLAGKKFVVDGKNRICTDCRK